MRAHDEGISGYLHEHIQIVKECSPNCNHNNINNFNNSTYPPFANNMQSSPPPSYDESNNNYNYNNLNNKV